jgi:uncharacterized iron-regulated membrane protein
MKNNIPQLVATALFAVLATTTVQAESRLVNQGRAGYTAVPVTKTSSHSAKNAGPETRVALVMEKPQQPISKMQPAGRAGYAVVPNPSR